MAMVVVGTRTLQSENNSFHLRDASFSSTEYVKKADDEEIDVFEAEKYFNGAIEEIKPEYVQLKLPRVRFQSPNIRSESSWNNTSGAVLLQRTSKNKSYYIHPLPRTNKNNQIKNFISTLGSCNCYCNGRNSVDILQETTLARRSIQSTPIERKSLYIFGSPVQRIPVPSSIRSIDGETDSEASSDLFEIESFTTTNTNTNTNTNSNNKVNRRISIDGTNTPSEASVDWSVVTASAADISALSDFDDMRTMSFCSNSRKLAAGQKNDDHVLERRRSGILSGCKSYKAVRVAGDAYKGRNKKMGTSTSSNGCRILMQHNESESNYLPTTKFGKVAGFEDLRNERLGFHHPFVSQSRRTHYPHFLCA